ncbi:spore germination protein [Paenibacillus soyae]|uniref:Spore germination protein n=1 Tax=Paenibacillus soyae TaxID=2969249 RepID=A0A9X2SC58_9BACL|nr:spore germination protein [Paenibacillus soyae]MCR2805672.1 spore germination protein [Paenibacillus soyae]
MKKKPTRIPNTIQETASWIQDQLGASPDIILRAYSAEGAGAERVVLVYIDSLVDNDTVNSKIVRPIQELSEEAFERFDERGLYALMKDRILGVGSIAEIDTFDHVIQSLLEGNTIILVDGYQTALAAQTAGGDERGVEEPTSQTVIRGPKEGFTENIKTNMSLLRRRIKSPKLRFVQQKIGEVTQTSVVIVYLDGIANQKIVKEITRRLSTIDTDSILESGYIEEFIQDRTYTPFPTLQNSERPDGIAAGILEGQIAIIVDGTPFVLLAPVTFNRFFQSSEDYYQRFDIASFLRLIRYGSFLASMLLPSLYIAITTFHQEMIPTTLLISLAAQREGTPFPAIVEAFIMEITFEVLREAGVRMPRAIGSAISIVGALVLGQAAVQAGLVSAAMVIVVSFTAIANFVIPSMNMAAASRLIRFGLMILGGTFGLFGIMSGLMFMLIHMAGLRSFGIPYLLPVSPLSINNLKDVFIRAPWWRMSKRPTLVSEPEAETRQGKSQKPEPPNTDPAHEGDRG